MCIRRAGRTGVGNSGRGVLSMSALSHGVVRVDNENSLTSLTLQDAGQVLPGGWCHDGRFHFSLFACSIVQFPKLKVVFD